MFRGTFSGPNAETRLRAFDDLRLSGEIVWLTWESFRRRVVVKSFVADYHSPWWIPYQVSCVVVDQIGTTSATQSTLLDQITSDLGNALIAVASSAISLSPLATALSSTNALTAGAADRMQAVAAVGTTLDAINSEIATQSALLIAPPDVIRGPVSISQTLSTIVSSAGLVAAAVNARSYVSRIGTNLVGKGS